MSNVIVRLGSHAEKEYLLKLGRFFDGVIIGANLLEATPGATSSLLVKMGHQQPYYIDPMTYAYGQYIDHDGQLRQDLDWIKSEQQKKDANGKKRTVRGFKRSYLKLAKSLDVMFSDALARGKAIAPDDFDSSQITTRVSEAITRYQLDRVQSEFRSDPELADIANEIRSPAAVFAPYFYLEPKHREAWFHANLKLMSAAAKSQSAVPVHGVLCADASILEDGSFLNRIKTAIPDTKISGLWLWLSGFYEESATTEALVAFRDLVQSLSASLTVFNMHGGYFSLGMSAHGLTGTSHGIGYGEQKDVVPVIGQSTPTVRYYLPALHRRLGVPEIERCFDDLEISLPAHFYEYVCDCVVCKGVVRRSVKDFGAFGETHYSTQDSKRKAQTPAAAKRCRMHFLLQRIRERDLVKKHGLNGVLADLGSATEQWCDQPSLIPVGKHISRWQKVLAAER